MEEGGQERLLEKAIAKVRRLEEQGVSGIALEQAKGQVAAEQSVLDAVNAARAAQESTSQVASAASEAASAASSAASEAAKEVTQVVRAAAHEIVEGVRQKMQFNLFKMVMDQFRLQLEEQVLM